MSLTFTQAALRALAEQEAAERQARRDAERILLEKRAQIAALERRQAEEAIAELDRLLKERQSIGQNPSQAASATIAVESATAVQAPPVAHWSAPPVQQPAPTAGSGSHFPSSAIPINDVPFAPAGQHVPSAGPATPPPSHSMHETLATTTASALPSDFAPLGTSSPSEKVPPVTAEHSAGPQVAPSVPSFVPEPAVPAPIPDTSMYKEFKTAEGLRYTRPFFMSCTVPLCR